MNSQRWTVASRRGPFWITAFAKLFRWSRDPNDYRRRIIGPQRITKKRINSTESVTANDPKNNFVFTMNFPQFLGSSSIIFEKPRLAKTEVLLAPG